MRIVLLPLVLLACSREQSPQPSIIDADSLALERTRCLGTCPAYRVSLTARGHVTFASRNPGDSTTRSDSVPLETLTMLVRRANTIGFARLPNRLMSDTALCAIVATDHPTITVTIYSGASVRSVEDYHGCRRRDGAIPDQLHQLRAYEAAIDTATGAQRWIRPARFR